MDKTKIWGVRNEDGGWVEDDGEGYSYSEKLYPRFMYWQESDADNVAKFKGTKIEFTPTSYMRQGPVPEGAPDECPLCDRPMVWDSAKEKAPEYLCPHCLSITEGITRVALKMTLAAQIRKNIPNITEQALLQMVAVAFEAALVLAEGQAGVKRPSMGGCDGNDA